MTRRDAWLVDVHSAYVSIECTGRAPTAPPRTPHICSRAPSPLPSIATVLGTYVHPQHSHTMVYYWRRSIYLSVSHTPPLIPPSARSIVAQLPDTAGTASLKSSTPIPLSHYPTTPTLSILYTL